MSDEVMNNLLALLKGSMDGSRMTADQSVQIMKGIRDGIQEDTKRMETAVKQMEKVLKEFAHLIGESLVLVPESIVSAAAKGIVEKEVHKEETWQTEKETYPVAFFYRSKVPGTHGSDGFYLVIDETEEEIVFYLYDQNQSLVSSGRTADKTLPIPAIEAMAMNKDVLDFYSCYRMKPEMIKMQVRTEKSEKSQQPVSQTEAEPEMDPASEEMKREVLEQMIEADKDKELQNKPRTL